MFETGLQVEDDFFWRQHAVLVRIVLGQQHYELRKYQPGYFVRNNHLTTGEYYLAFVLFIFVHDSQLNFRILPRSVAPAHSTSILRRIQLTLGQLLMADLQYFGHICLRQFVAELVWYQILVFRVFFNNVQLAFLPSRRALDLFKNRFLVYQPGCITLCSKVLLQKPKVVLVTDLSVFVAVDGLKCYFQVVFRGIEFDERKSVLDSFVELLFIHDSLGAFLVEFLLVKTLYCQLPEVLFHAEVDQLIILNDSVIVVVVPEDVTYHVFDFSLGLVKNMLQKVSDFVLLELLVIIAIEGDDFEVDGFSDGEGELVGLEVEALAFVGFAFDFDQLALACFDLAVVKGSHRYSNLKSSGIQATLQQQQLVRVCN